MQGSAAAQALSRQRWQAIGARERVRGQWTGENNPTKGWNAAQKRAKAKQLTEGRWRRDAAKQAAKLQAQMDVLRAIADELWGDWRPKPPRVQGLPRYYRLPGLRD
jgi:hypothetical protein